MDSNRRRRGRVPHRSSESSAATGRSSSNGYEREAGSRIRRARGLSDASEFASGRRDLGARDRSDAQIRVRRPATSANVVARALTLDNTTWTDADQVWASEGGAGGVIFVKDPSGKLLVVKPNIRGVEERLSADLHHQMATTNKPKSWKLGELPMRLATAGDVLAIRNRATQLWVGPPPARLATLLAALAADTTMIQEGAPQGAKTLGRAMSDQAEAGGHFDASSKNQKLLSASPLKPLFNKPEYAETLGRAAAADLFMGNFDRLVGTLGNVENFMVHAASKQIFLIDNIGANVSRDVFDTEGDGQAEFSAWANNDWVADFKAARVDRIARNAWSDVAPDLAALMTLKSMLAAGSRADQQNQQHDFMSTGDRTKLDAKLTKKDNAHFEKIVGNFAAGLYAGLERIAIVGTVLAAGAGTQKAKRQADARRRFLTGGQGADAAWQAATLAYP